MREIGSHDLEAKLAELNEMELHTAFKAMVGCDGKKIFVALDERAFDYFSKDSKYYKFKKLLIERKEFVTEFASAFRLDVTPLYRDIENIIKDFCRELEISQKELAEIFGLSTSAISQWNEELPKTAQVALELLVENKKLKNDLSIIKKAHEILHR